jgi:hypothetical protein
MNNFNLEQLAAEYEVPVDYLHDEFIIDYEFQLCDTFFAMVDDSPIILCFEE